MRILVVQESDWIARGPHQSHHLMERLSERGHAIRVIDYEISWKERKERRLKTGRLIFEDVHKVIKGGGVTVIRPPIINVPGLDYISLIYTHYEEIRRQIDHFRPDVIVGFGILNANIAIRLSRKKGIPFVYYIIDELHRLVPEKNFRGLARYIESMNMKWANKVISINEGLREYTIQMGAAEDRTEVIRAGVDLDRFCSEGRSAIRDKHGIGDDDLVLFFMGWLYHFSGLREVALELGKSENEHFKLMIVGKGDLLSTLHEIKHKYGMDKNLIIIDWVPYEEIPQYLAASDICILPAYNNEIMEHIVPIKLYEYMAAGKPVISTRIYGITREFGDNNGIIYVDKPDDVLGKAIDLANEGFLHQQGSSARKFVEKYSWDNVVDEFEKIIGEL